MRVLASAISETRGDVLVFLPGRREIERMRAVVQDRWGHELDVHTLYGDMRAAEQDAVLQGVGRHRRVILATDIAETSLTIEGVQAVVDSGLARKPVFDPNTGLTHLQTRWISKASAAQRAGRAGRLGPGHCYRGWNSARQERLEDWTPAEIMQADLAPLVLELANWGVASAGGLQWLDPPPTAHWAQAVDLLQQLGAVDAGGRITATGRRMARFPAHPRLAHVLAAAADPADQGLASDVAALMSERDPMRRGRDMGADLRDRLDALHAWRDKAPGSADIDRAALKQIDRVARQFLQLCAKPAAAKAAAMSPARCLTLAYPDRVAMCTSRDGRRYLMRNGRAALLRESDPLRGSPLLAVAAADAGRHEGFIRLAAPIAGDEFEDWFGDQVCSRRELRWDPDRGDLGARQVKRLDALLLSDEPVALCAEDPVAEMLIEQIRSQGLAAFFRDPVGLRARVELMRTVHGEAEWPDFSDQGLLSSIEQWLSPWLKGGEGARQLQRISLKEVLSAWLGWERKQALERELPTHFDTPAGTRRPIRYGLDGSVILAVPLQEVLGLSTGPVLANGRVPLVLHLLSPAGRPLQVTADLAAFWRGAYAEVKKEMRGRYPKHYWPDDPAQARATRFSKRRMDKES
jgi:ATP-dependent helicase HrpB